MHTGVKKMCKHDVALVGAPFHIRQGQRFWYYVLKWKTSVEKKILKNSGEKSSLANDPFSEWCALAAQRQHFCLASRTTRNSNSFWRNVMCVFLASHSNRVKFKRKIITIKHIMPKFAPQKQHTSAHRRPTQRWRNKKVPNSHKSIFRTFLFHFISFS